MNLRVFLKEKLNCKPNCLNGFIVMCPGNSGAGCKVNNQHGKRWRTDFTRSWNQSCMFCPSVFIALECKVKLVALILSYKISVAAY